MSVGVPMSLPWGLTFETMQQQPSLIRLALQVGCERQIRNLTLGE